MRGTLYDRIADEISGGQIDKGLWTEAFAVTDGDERLTRSQYIKLRVRRLRSQGVRENPRVGGGKAGGGSFVDGALLDAWALWLWGWTFAFAMMTTAGVLSLIVKLSLHLFDDGLIVWPFVTAGCGFMTCFLFQRGVQALIVRPPTAAYYAVEIAGLAAAAWALSRGTEPTALDHLPRVLIPELVYLMVRFFHSPDPVTNLFSVVMFFLPIYGVVVFVRHKMI